jgi:hypothetical protein
VYCNSHTSHPKVTPIHVQTRQSSCCHDASFQKQWHADPSVDAADIQRPSKQKDAAANQFGQSPSQARSLRQWSSYASREQSGGSAKSKYCFYASNRASKKQLTAMRYVSWLHMLVAISKTSTTAIALNRINEHTFSPDEFVRQSVEPAAKTGRKYVARLWRVAVVATQYVLTISQNISVMTVKAGS